MRIWNNLIAISLACSTVFLASTVEGGPCTCDTTSTGLKLCVQFDNSGNTPAEGTDFDFDFTDPDAPSVDLTEGDDSAGTTYQWRIWCEDSAGDEANMGAITGSLAEDYDVTILDDTDGPGAINVGGANLDPSDEENYSRIRVGHITGDLTGTTFVQERPPTVPPTQEQGHGDIYDLTVDGSVTGNITTEGLIFNLKIVGDLVGDLTTDFIYDYVFVDGDVSGDVVVGAILNGGRLKILGDASGDITVDKFGFGALLRIDGAASGFSVTLSRLPNLGSVC